MKEQNCANVVPIENTQFGYVLASKERHSRGTAEITIGLKILLFIVKASHGHIVLVISR